jgi:patatin-like phospholipase/acyl hydrolase
MVASVRILSIDGGGIRGIVPGYVLVALEEKLKARTGDQNTRIADCFDMIAGTSTGGILTCLYLCPDLQTGRPRFSADEAVDLYMERGDEVFDVSLWHRIRSAGGLRDEKYSADGLEEVLDDYFGQLQLSELIGPCLVTAYDIRRRQTTFFNQIDAAKRDEKNFLVKDVARATSAAPTYFEVARIKSATKVPYPLIDGGVFANNPALCAYAEARKKLRDNPRAADMAVLSIGTGHGKIRSYDYKTAKDWGMVEWALPLLDILMSGVSETVDYQLGQIFDAVGHPEQYLRINDELEFGSPALDDASRDNLLALREDGERIAKKFDKDLTRFVELLV